MKCTLAVALLFAALAGCDSKSQVADDARCNTQNCFALNA